MSDCRPPMRGRGLKQSGGYCNDQRIKKSLFGLGARYGVCMEIGK